MKKTLHASRGRSGSGGGGWRPTPRENQSLPGENQSLPGDVGGSSGSDFLVLNRISKSYRDGKVLDELSLSLGRGECLTLLGPSGCGKSTCLNIIAGLLMPDEGDVFLEGRSITDVPAEERNLGVVFQQYALFPHMTVLENVAFGLKIRKVKGKDLLERATRSLETVGLLAFKDRHPSQLSGGQQQRVALARALAIEPPVLLLDEPLSNLDAQLRTEMALELLEIRKRLGTTTVFVTHDQKEAMLLGDKIAILNQGRVEQAGTPKDVYETPASMFVANFIGENNAIHGMVAIRDGMRLLYTGEGSDAEISISIDNVRVDDKVIALVRPEDLTLSDTRISDANYVRAIVKQVLYLGEKTIVSLEAPSGELRVSQTSRAGSGKHPLVGEAVYASWLPHDMTVLREQ